MEDAVSFVKTLKKLARNFCTAVSGVMRRKNKVGYTATPVACWWAGAVLEKVIRAFGQEQ